MDVVFRTRMLQRCYERSDDAVRRWGPEAGRAYIQIIELLYAARNLDAVRAFRSLRLHQLGGDRKGDWSIVLHGRWRLIVIPSENGDAVTVEEVTNHYGD